MARQSPKNGVGSNQYQKRGRTQARSATPEGSLVSQIDPELNRRVCGEVWGTNCKARVSAPAYRHGKHPDRQQRITIAMNPEALGHVLEDLASDHDDEVRFCVARNPHTFNSALVCLSRDPNEGVRYGVAGHRTTSRSSLEYLSRDPSGWVRQAVARNPNTAGPVLGDLSRDLDPEVRRRVAVHLNTPSLIRALLQVTGI